MAASFPCCMTKACEQWFGLRSHFILKKKKQFNWPWKNPDKDQKICSSSFFNHSTSCEQLKLNCTPKVLRNHRLQCGTWQLSPVSSSKGAVSRQSLNPGEQTLIGEVRCLVEWVVQCTSFCQSSFGSYWAPLCTCMQVQMRGTCSGLGTDQGHANFAKDQKCMHALHPLASHLLAKETDGSTDRWSSWQSDGSPQHQTVNFASSMRTLFAKCLHFGDCQASGRQPQRAWRYISTH